MLQPQGFLSSLGIPYADCPTQKDLTDKAQAVLASERACEAGTYNTPGNLTSIPVNPAVMDLSKINEHSAAVIAMLAAISMGDVAMAHADLDRANSLAAAIGDAIIPCPKSDIQILANAAGWLGRVARDVANDNFPVKVNGETVQLSNVAIVKPLIDSLVAQSPAPPPPAPVAPVPQYLSGPLPGLYVGQEFSYPDGSRWMYGALPFGPPPFNAIYYVVRIG